MGKLGDVQNGSRSMPPRIVVYGQEGLGKSTWASNAPNPIFIQTEDGLGQIKADRFPLAKNYKDVIESISELVTQKHDYKTVVIDSADWLEPLIFEDVCRDYGVDTIFKAAGGFNRGYEKAVDKWAEVCSGLDWLRANKNMTVIVIAHNKIKKFEDPENSTYDKYQLRLNDKACDYLTEWSDCVLFACRKMVVTKVDGGTRNVANAVGKGGGERILRTNASPACIAKNRYSLPDEIPLTWSEFAKFVFKEEGKKNPTTAIVAVKKQETK